MTATRRAAAITRNGPVTSRRATLQLERLFAARRHYLDGATSTAQRQRDPPHARRALRPGHPPDHNLHWSLWRRHQATARQRHYQRRHNRGH